MAWANRSLAVSSVLKPCIGTSIIVCGFVLGMIFPAPRNQANNDHGSLLQLYPANLAFIGEMKHSVQNGIVGGKRSMDSSTTLDLSGTPWESFYHGISPITVAIPLRYFNIVSIRVR